MRVFNLKHYEDNKKDRWRFSVSFDLSDGSELPVHAWTYWVESGHAYSPGYMQKGRGFVPTVVLDQPRRDEISSIVKKEIERLDKKQKGLELRDAYELLRELLKKEELTPREVKRRDEALSTLPDEPRKAWAQAFTLTLEEAEDERPSKKERKEVV